MIAVAGMAGTNGVMVASHRADWRFAPENSLESLKNAIRFGADIIETNHTRELLRYLESKGRRKILK